MSLMFYLVSYLFKFSRMEVNILLILSIYGIIIVGKSKALSIIDEVRSFDVIRPHHLHHSRTESDLNTREKDGRHLQNTSFYLSSTKYNVNFTINIDLNRDLLTREFHIKYQAPNGDFIKLKTPVDHCYYHGVVDNQPDSVVVLSTCNGLRGAIYNGRDVYQIYPDDSQSKSLDQHIFFHSKDYIANNETCSVHQNEAHGFADDILLNHNRFRRANAKMKHISLALVVDKQTYQKFGSSKVKAGDRAIEVANYIDRVYKTINTRVPLVWVEVWNVRNQIALSTDPSVTLTEFRKYHAQGQLKNPDYTYDNMQLLTGIDFDGTTVGMAGIATICTPGSCGVNMDRGNALVPTGNTVSHEMGHNLGMTHDDTKCTCSTPPCVMTPSASHFRVNGFSTCSINDFNKLINDGKTACLLDVPQKLFGDPVCGNGFLEEGEACDCGSVEDCKRYGLDDCCNATICKLQETAQCAVGPCCDKCQYKSKGTECRSSEHDCDLKEFCTGSSEFCPANHYKHDGTECERGQGYCYDGACRTIDNQCATLWGEDARKGEHTCYKLLNVKGTEDGNCGKDSRGAFIACQERNLYCGKLQCKDMKAEFPQINANIVVRTFRYGSLSCRTTFVKGLTDASDPTLTTDGTKCTEGHMCLNQVCKNISQIESIRNCKDGCSNGGVCNNLGHCHCPYGYACPDCKEEGIGGSIDSGQGCLVGLPESKGLSGTTVGLLIFFLLIVPLLLVAAYLTYRFRHRLPIGKKATISKQRPQRRSFSKFKDEKPKPTGIDNPAGPNVNVSGGPRQPPPIHPPKTIHGSKPSAPPMQSRGPPARTAPPAPVRSAPKVPPSNAKRPPVTPSKPLPKTAMKPPTNKAGPPPPPYLR